MSARRRVTCVTMVVAASLLVAADAGAATQIGATFDPTGTGNCGPDAVELQTTSPGSLYAAPTPGVVTGWSIQGGTGGDSPGTMKLKLARPAGINSFQIVGESALVTPAPGTLNSFATRISAAAGDVIGIYYAGYSGCIKAGQAGYALHEGTGDPAVGSTAVLTPGTGLKLDVAATLEPDADVDGFGDETQDACVGQGGPENGCPATDATAPETTITERPKDKTRKKQATFEFSSEAGASFECSLDGGSFAACSSPDTLKVKKGKHTFSVRAIDAAGNIDASPASDDWKVKKKRRK